MSDVKVFSVAQMDDIVSYLVNKINSLKVIEVPELKPLNQCTITEVLDYIDGYYKGWYSLEDIQGEWNVGDTISVSLSAISANATYSMQANSAQTLSYAIADFNHDVLTNSIGTKTKALLTLTPKAVLNSNQQLHAGASASTLDDGSYWDTCNLRNWLNSDVYNALPSNIKSAVKGVSRQCNAIKNGERVDDKVFSPTINEMMGSGGSVGTQYSYFTTAANRNIGYFWLSERRLDGGAGRWHMYYNGGDNIQNDPADAGHSVLPMICL